MSIFVVNKLNMNTYTMSQVENLTGIKSHTLRIWERRYDFLNPERTDSNIRYYSDVELRKLLNISILVNNKVRVSAINKMTEEEIHAQIISISTSEISKYEDDLNRLVLSMITFDEDLFNNIFQKHVNSKGLLLTIKEFIYPFLAHVGVLWITNKAIPAQEHFVSNLIRQKIIAATDAINLPNNDLSSIIMFLPENENHEIALVLANYIAKDLGFSVYYLGQNVPIENIIAVMEVKKVAALLTMFITPVSKEYKKKFEKTFSKVTVPFFISGNYTLDEATNTFVKVNSPSELIERLKSLKF